MSSVVLKSDFLVSSGISLHASSPQAGLSCSWEHEIVGHAPTLLEASLTRVLLPTDTKAGDGSPRKP